MSLSTPQTIIGMVNGMIGGFILILPVNALAAGWVYSLLVIIIIGAFSFYSCYLSIVHLGDQKDLDYAMFNHFNKSYVIKIIYDLTVFSNLLFLAFLYFDLICIQWQGITGKQSLAIPLVNMVILFVFIFILKYFQFGASIMAYGIISIIGYVLFLIWVVASAPSGQKQWQPLGQGQVNLAAAMGGAYSIQTFFIPILKRNPNQGKYVFYTMIAYIIGACVYFYIAYMGAFGILNRIPIVPKPQDIENFFSTGTVQVIIIQVLYLIHLYSVFPEFTLISKKRIFSIFHLKQTQKGKIPIPEIIYAIIFVGLCLLINLLNVRIDTIVNLNGSVIGFFFIYFLPAILHIKCLYFSKKRIMTMQEKRKWIQENNIDINLAAINNVNKLEINLVLSNNNNKINAKSIQKSIQLQDNHINYNNNNDTSRKVTIVQMSDYNYNPNNNINNNNNNNTNITKNKVSRQHIQQQKQKQNSRQSSIYHTVIDYDISNTQKNNQNYNKPQNNINKQINLLTINTQNKKQQLIQKIQTLTTDQHQHQHQLLLLNYEMPTYLGKFVCDCKKSKSIPLQILQLIILIIMILLGAFILVNGIMSVAG